MKLSKQQDSKSFIDVSEGLILGPEDGEKLVRHWGHPFLIKIDEVNGGATQFTVGSEKLLPGKLIHKHRHNNFEEILIIQAGSGTLLLGDNHSVVKAGSLVFIPQGVWHGLENTGTEVIDLLWIFPKLGMEQYFRATSVAAGQQPLPLSNDELNRIRASHLENVEYQDVILKSYII